MGGSREGCPVKGLRAKIAAQWNVPEDALFDVSRITWISRKQLHIENHRGLARFRADQLTVLTPDGPLAITGKNLEVEAMTEHDLFIHGDITDCRYLTRSER